MRAWIHRVLVAGAIVVLTGGVHAQERREARARLLLSACAVNDHIVRIRFAREDARNSEGSWTIPSVAPERCARAESDAETIATTALRVSFDSNTLAIRITDAVGQPILLDSTEPITFDGPSFTLHKQMGGAEHIFGMGDKTGGLDRRGKSFVNWNTDSYGFSSSDDPLYKSVPFYVSSGGAGGAYGLLLDNPYRSWFDFGHRREGEIAIGAEDGPIDYYVIAGPTIADVVRRYTELTGRAPLPPRWVLGYQQSRWSYMSEAEVRALAAKLRKEAVPTDVIWLDIDYQDRNRPFTIDRKAFPHFSEMVRDLDAAGFKTVAITDLHVALAPNQGYRPYDEGVAGDHFVRNANGSTYVGPVWPGPAVFPDFTRAATREWWGSLFSGLVDDGVAGIWNDMNEPAIFNSPSKTMPLDVRHRIEGDGFAARSATHEEVHNVYGMENSRATYEGLRRLRPDERAFVMTRASFAGGQRYAATWTGDNSSSWDHLRLAVAQTLNLGLSGFSWVGADVGGFTGGPNPELMTRWFEFAAFAPIFRDHSQKDAPRAEPWVDGPDHLAIRRRYVEERYRLMPYLYSLAEINARTGDPVMRPLFYDYPQALGAECNMAMQFTLGGKLLVAGAPKPESTAAYKACLPAGGWYDYWTGAKVFPAPVGDGVMTVLELAPRIDVLPVFVRAGAVVPRQPLVQSTSQRPDGPLELHIYPGPGCRGEIYDDDGHSMGFARGNYSRQDVTCTAGQYGLAAISIGKREGRYQPWWKELRIVVHGDGSYRAILAGRVLPTQNDGNAISFTVRASAQPTRIRLARAKA